MLMRFTNRIEAGKALAAKLGDYAGQANLIVLALPRGGVPVAFEVAKALGAPLDVLVVRKLGVPGHEEFAFGAISSGGVRVLSEDIVRGLKLSESLIDGVVQIEQKELNRRERLYRGERSPLDLRGKIVIVVDDGLATGATMLAAVKAVRMQEPQKIIMAAPVAARETCNELSYEADVLCVCSIKPEPFYSVGTWYQDFSQTSDDEVKALLAKAEETMHMTHSAY